MQLTIIGPPNNCAPEDNECKRPAKDREPPNERMWGFIKGKTKAIPRKSYNFNL